MKKSVKKAFGATAQDLNHKSKKDLLVVDYAEAGPALRQQMEAVMAPIFANPQDSKVIASYGAHLVDEILDAYKKINKMSQDELLKDAKKLLPCMLETVHEIGGYIGTTKEVLRNYDGNFIPTAADWISRLTLRQRRAEFLERSETLESARALGTLLVNRLQSSAEQQELLDIIDMTKFGEENLKPRKNKNNPQP